VYGLRGNGGGGGESRGKQPPQFERYLGSLKRFIVQLPVRTRGRGRGHWFLDLGFSLSKGVMTVTVLGEYSLSAIPFENQIQIS